MAGEVTDRFNEVTLFRIALFWQKQSNDLQNLQSRTPILLGILLFTCFTDFFHTGWNVDRWVAGRHAPRIISGRGLFMVVQLSSRVKCKFNKQIGFNPSCMKVFGTHTFYEGGGGGLTRPPSHVFGNGRLYNLQLWQAIRTIYER